MLLARRSVCLFMAFDTLSQTANTTVLSSACAASQSKGPAPDTQILACIYVCVLPAGHVMESIVPVHAALVTLHKASFKPCCHCCRSVAACC